MNIYILNKQSRNGETIQLRAFSTEKMAQDYAYMNDVFESLYIYFITEIPFDCNER
jgi:hypothetical protein